MEIIKKLVKQMDEELHDAKKYAECALKYKEAHPALANAYYMLSGEELKHMNILHAEAVKVIEEYKAKHGEAPAAMKAIWDYKHEERIEEAEEVNILQRMFK
jgi:ferritin